MTLADKIEASSRFLPQIDPRYCIVFEPDIDSHVHIIVPGKAWLAAARHGGIIPSVYDVLAGKSETGPPIGPLTEEQAMEYLVQRDVPPAILADGNRRRFVICRNVQVPEDRTFRNAWRLAA